MRKSEFVDSYFDAWNHHDAKGIADHLANDGTFRDVPENVQASPDELIVNLQHFFSNYKHCYELTGEIQRGKNSIAFQYRMFQTGKNPRRNVSFLSWCGVHNTAW